MAKFNVIRSGAIGIAFALAGCSYASEADCLAAHAACHIGALDGDWHAGAGIPVNSPAGAAILGGLMRNMQPAPSYNVYVHPGY